MDYYNSLVAGGEDEGFRDGAFSLARFHDPLGLAWDEGGQKLYVADSGNQRIRVVDLGQNNDVKTLAGTGTSGSADGPVSTATFNYPTKLSTLPGNRLAVYDDGSRSIRMVDLQTQNVSTLAKGIHVLDMVYRPLDDSLYFSEADSKKIEKLNLQSRVVSDVIANNSQVPSPGALCIDQDHLCVADKDLPEIYECLPASFHSPVASATSSGASVPAAVSVSLSMVGKVKDVMALSVSGGVLYALQKGGLLVKVGLPDSSMVKLQTAWGLSFNNQDHQGGMPLFNIRDGLPAGFSASPLEPRKFFISARHLILCVKDYDFENRWGAIVGDGDDITDFNYPAKKPEKTFRILVTGSSKNSTSILVPSEPASIIDENIQTPKINIFSKQLDFMLNTDAALRNLGIHFEVLNYTRRGQAISSYVYDKVPDLVKKYDIDLVLGFADLTGYPDYYLSPMTSEGIPSNSVHQDYKQKPLSERATSRVAKDLIARCKILKIPFSEKQDCPGDGIFSLISVEDAQLEKDLIEMTGRRLQLLQEKLQSLKTSRGAVPQLALFYVPFGGVGEFPNDRIALFWSDVCVQYRLKYLNLSESYNAFKISYFPANRGHYTIYGNELIARLLEYDLSENKLIPF